MQHYDPKAIEPKWQKKWEDDGLYKTPEDATLENKTYILPQLPYPSGSGLHVGHAEVYTACDIYARYLRMKGRRVLQVFGLDSFGLPAENYAIKNNVHPRETIEKTGAHFVEQVKALGVSVDWDRFVRSSDPEYYKWTQWLFLVMYKRGLAYRREQSVNWCESCKTVLANEQVVEGNCERCDTVVEQRNMEQWYLKITKYADRLLQDLEKIDWPEETKKRQANWIGRSEGALIAFGIRDSALSIPVFTTAHDTIYGVTFMVLAPEHELVAQLKEQVSNWKEVSAYVDATKKKTEMDRQTQKEKTGVELQGVIAINPVNGAEVPVWVADYVLASYGTGSIMAVPGSDERDYEFAQKYNIPVTFVVEGADTFTPYQDIKDAPKKFTVSNSGEFDGQDFEEARAGMLKKLLNDGAGESQVQFKLRDWSVSRQRFWGAPIPMVSNKERREKKRQYVFVHGYTATGLGNFRAWLKEELEELGHSVIAPDLPNSEKPNVKEQAQYLLDNVKFDEDTVIVAHSLGGPVTYRVLEQLGHRVAKVVLVDTVLRPDFPDKKRPDVEASDSFDFDFEKIRDASDEFVYLADEQNRTIKKEHVEEIVELLDARIVVDAPREVHYTAVEEPLVLEEAIVTGLMPVHEDDLPVLLPDDVDFKPTGQSPLTYSDDFQKGVEEKYGKGWKREVDTLDTFMCSSWYYFRYLDPNNSDAFASKKALDAWMPVDFYLGGEEHVNGHLLYSRFLTKVLHDAGIVSFDEPFAKHRHQGLILGPDSRKMSKRWGNVVNPTDVVNQYGADTLRMYEMFMGPLEQTKPWSDNGVKGIRRFLEKVWKLQEKVSGDRSSVTFDSLVHKTLKKVTDDLEEMKFNTAIAKMMELLNAAQKEEKISQKDFELILHMLAPFAPHIAEEMWSSLGHSESITMKQWPDYDESKLVEEKITLVVQINGKVRANIDVDADIDEDSAKAQALAHENVVKWLDGTEPKKVIYVKGKLVSFVV